MSSIFGVKYWFFATLSAYFWVAKLKTTMPAASWLSGGHRKMAPGNFLPLFYAITLRD